MEKEKYFAPVSSIQDRKEEIIELEKICDSKYILSTVFSTRHIVLASIKEVSEQDSHCFEMTGRHRDDPHEISLRCLETLSCYLKMCHSFHHFLFFLLRKIWFKNSILHIYIYVYIFFVSPFLRHGFERRRIPGLNVMESLISNQSSLNCSLESRKEET